MKNLSFKTMLAMAVLAIALASLTPANAEEKPEIFVQLGHSGNVKSVAFSPDGKYVVSGSEDKTMKLWNIETGKEIRTFSGHSESINSVAFSPDSRYALSGSGDGTLKLWDVSTGKQIRSFSANSCIHSIGFSPNGKYALSGGDKGDTFFHKAENTLKLWDIDTGKQLHTFQGYSNSVYSVVFSPDGNYALSGNEDKTLKLWDVKTGEEIRSFLGHSGEVNSVAFSLDGKLALSGSSDTTLKLWNVETGKEIRTFSGQNLIKSIMVSPDFRFALSGGDNQTLKLWDIQNGKEIHTFSEKINHASIEFVAFSPDGKYVLSDNLELWEVRTGNLVRTFSGHQIDVHSAVFAPNGKSILSGVWDDTLKLWNVETGSEIKTFNGHSFAFSPNGRYALSDTKDNTLKLWDLETGKEIRTYSKHPAVIRSVTFSSDGKYILSGSNDDIMTKYSKEKSQDSTLKLWNVESGEEIHSFSEQESVYSVALSPDGKYALSGGFKDTLELWDVRTGMKIRSLKGHELVSVWSVAFSPDGKYALSGAGDNTAKLWDVEYGRVIRTFSGHSDFVMSVSFSPNGKYVLSGSWDKTINLWEIETGKNIRKFLGHSGGVDSVMFSPDGRYALSGSNDGTTRLWNIQSGKEIIQKIYFKDNEWLTITPEGYYNASPNGDKHLNVRIGNNVYGIDQYKAKYFRPDIVQLALKLGDTQQAIAQLKGDTEGLKTSEEPPKVWFVSPKDQYETDKPMIEIQVKTEDIADEAESVTFYVNSRPLATEKKPVRPVAEGAKIREFSRQVPLVPGSNFIEVEARGRAGATQKTMIVVIRKGTAQKLPALWYFGAGVSQHSMPSLSLNYAAKDVTGLADALKRQKGQAYSEVNVRILTDSEATRGSIMDGVESFFTSAKQEDVAILFVSGHGMNSASGYYFIAHDSNPDKLSSTGVPGEFFNNVLKTVKCSVLLFADTCHSGNISSADPNEFLRGAADNGVIVFSSSSGGSVSREDPSWGHGAFAKALIDGIMGAAATRYNMDTVKLIFLQEYVKETVLKLTDNTQQPVIPKLTGAGQFLDLVLARKP